VLTFSVPKHARISQITMKIFVNQQKVKHHNSHFSAVVFCRISVQRDKSTQLTKLLIIGNLLRVKQGNKNS